MFTLIMKKIIVAILALLYITTSTGAAIHMHYCMGQLADWGIGRSDSKTCGNCGMDKSNEKDNGCCKDEHKQIKLKTDHQKVESTAIINMLFAPIITPPATSFNFQPFLQITESYPTCHAPPAIVNIKLHVLHCVFLI